MQTRKGKLREAISALKALGFGPKQSNEVAGYTLLALLNLEPKQSWKEAAAPLRGITPIIEFTAKTYGVTYAPNTRETIRDEAVKYFVEYGLLVRNPDAPTRPANSGNTVYQVEAHALKLLRSLGTLEWEATLDGYLRKLQHIREEIQRMRTLARIPVILPSGKQVVLSPGGQNPLIKIVVEEFCQCFLPEGSSFTLETPKASFYI